jgi:hypothetical protein
MVQHMQSINVLQHMNRIKYKNHIMISISIEKVFGKIQYLFTIKVLKKLKTEGAHHNI